jgi:hypothetical protein
MVDCTSNYENESAEMARANPPVDLTPDLWVLKLILGAIDPSYDTQDEQGSSQVPGPGQFSQQQQGYGQQQGGYGGQQQQGYGQQQQYQPPPGGPGGYAPPPGGPPRPQGGQGYAPPPGGPPSYPGQQQPYSGGPPAPPRY